MGRETLTHPGSRSRGQATCLVKLRFAQSITKQSDVGVVVGVVNNLEPDRANALPQGMTSNVTGGLLDELYA
jgi:hypothetical protein